MGACLKLTVSVRVWTLETPGQSGHREQEGAATWSALGVQCLSHRAGKCRVTLRHNASQHDWSGKCAQRLSQSPPRDHPGGHRDSRLEPEQLHNGIDT